MRRQLSAIAIGIVTAVIVIYAVFDQRVSFRKFVASAPSLQSPAN
jgi:hypothetical protein